MKTNGSVLTNSAEIIERLEALDVMCEQRGLEAELVVLGGAGILLLMEMNNRRFRPTRDIDVNPLSASDEQALYDALDEAQIEVVGGVMELPPMEDIENGSRFKIEGIDFHAINVYVPSVELLACSKIFSKREKDLLDLRETELLELCNKAELIHMVEEYKKFMLNINDLDVNVHELDSILMDKGI